MVFPSPNGKVILLGQRPYTGHSHGLGGPCTVAEKRHMTEDQELNTLEDMPGKRPRYQLQPRETNDSLYGLKALPAKVHTGR